MDDDYPDSQQETKRKKIYKAMSDRIVHVYNNLKADIRDEESKGSKYKDYMKEISELVDKIPTRPINRGDEEDELESLDRDFTAATSLGRTLHENAGNPWTSHGDAAAGSTQGASFNAARVWPGAHSTAAAGSTQGEIPIVAPVRRVAAVGSKQGENPIAAGVRPDAPSTAAASRNQPDSQDILQKAWASVAPRPVEITPPSSSAPEVSGNNDTFFQRFLAWAPFGKTAAAADPKAAAETDPKAAAATDPKAAAATDPKAAAATGPKAAAAAVSKPAEQPIVTPAAPSQGRLNLYESDDGNFRGTLEEVVAYEKSAASQPATIVDASQPATTNDPAATEEAVAFGLRDGKPLQDNAVLSLGDDLNQISFQGKEGTKIKGGYAFSSKHKPPLVTKGTIRFLDSTRPTSSAATASKSISKTKAQGGKFTKKETTAKSHSKKITFNVKSKRPTKKTIKKEIKFKVGASR